MALPPPLAYWPFDEGGGSTAADASGNGHTATLIAGTWDLSALKKFGTAALANSGTGRGASFTAINLGTVHSLAFWMNGWDGSNDGVILGGISTFYGCYIDGSGLYYSVGVGTYRTQPHGGLTGSRHVVITRNGATLTFYKDGALLGTQTLGASTALTLDTLSNYNDSTYGFAGTLDDVRLYDVALSGAQVAELYALIPAPPPAAGIRMTQAPIELLGGGQPDLRVTQGLVEVLGSSISTGVTAIQVTQAPVEVLGAMPVAIRVTQAPVEVLHTLLPRGWRVVIGGVDRTALVDMLNITWVLNERARASCTLGDFLPNKFDEVVSYAKDGTTPLFGGIIMTRNFRGRNPYDPTFTVTLECADWFIYTDWTYVTKSYAEGVSLKTVLQDLVTDYLSPYGVGLYPGQVDGPALAAFVWSNVRLSDAIRELTDRTGYVAQITPAKRLWMFEPGTDVAPFDLTEDAPHCQELSWTDSDRIVANKVTIIAGPNGDHDVDDELHYGDGVTRTFPLYAPYVAIHTHITTLPDGIFYPVGVYGSDVMPYTYDVALNAIQQDPGVAVLGPAEANTSFLISYIAKFPFRVSAWNGMTPIIEHIETRPDVLSIPAAQEIANGLLAQLSGAAKELAVTTDDDGFLVGQALTVDLATTRQVAGDFTITEVGLTIVQDTSADDEYWVYTLKAAESVEYQGSYLDDWRRITVSPSTATTE